MVTNQRERCLGPSIRMCDINIEGVSRAKGEFLSRMCLEHGIDVILVQETHASDASNLHSRCKVAGYRLVMAEYHEKYGTATYVRHGLDDVVELDSSSADNVFKSAVRINGIAFVNVYKPPEVEWPVNVIDTYEHPAIYCGDFNSHATDWGYQEDDVNGESVKSWAAVKELKLIYDPKERGTFHSARWRRDYNPDLCFTSCNSEGVPVGITRQVLQGFPHSQHRPIVFEIGLKVPLVQSVKRPRWNFNKAKWETFSKEFDDLVGLVPATAENYDRFTGLMIGVAKKHVPRGFRKEYIPCWEEDADRLYAEFESTGDHEKAEEILKSLDAARRQRWASTVSNMSFTHSSRFAWSLIRKLGAASPPEVGSPKIHPNKVARRIVRMSKMPSNRKFTRLITRKYRILRKRCPRNGEFSRPFSVDEVNLALMQTKTGKAAGFDCVYAEFLVHLGPRARRWLSSFFSNILSSNKLPDSFKRTKVIALLKPGKPAEAPDSYRPISLLSVTFKLFERLLYNRIADKINEVIPREQAGFRIGRSCTDQVLSLTNFIENGFQRKLKTGVVFVDLTAAYDTVWKRGLMYKLLEVIPCLAVCDIICNMLSDRIFQVFMNGKSSSKLKLNNGIPQGSVLAPLLFNLYVSDLPNSLARKFMYADDVAYAFQGKDARDIEQALSSDMDDFVIYCKNWRLNPSITKTESSFFHLNNRQAQEPLIVVMDGRELNFNKTPKYLGVTLDRTLTYKQHLLNLRGKLASRNNLISKLASTTWGADARTLRTTALSLVYSTAEYCSAVWLNSAHTHLVDTQMNTTMRLVSGTVKSTPTNWLPALADILPPDLRRQRALVREYLKASCSPDQPLYDDLQIPIISRLRSRNPPLVMAAGLIDNGFSADQQWRQRWDDCGLGDPVLFNFGGERRAEFELPRRAFVNLNRLRTKHGRSNQMLHRWGFKDSTACPCGEPLQTVNHMMSACPLTRFPGPAEEIGQLTPRAVEWLRGLNL